MNSQITYLYRDGSNYKRYNTVIVKGKMTSAHLARIEKCLFDGEYFVPRSVGLPEERSTDYRTDDDHCWFEWEIYQDDATGEYDLDYSGVELTDTEANVDLTVDELVANFEAVQQWDETGWMDDYDYRAYDELTPGDYAFGAF